MSWIPSPSRPVFHVTSLSTLLPYWNLGLLNSIVQRRSWNLSLAPSITRVKSFIPQGHTFIWQMINLLSAFWRDDHPIRLNREFHLSWSREFFISWDGLCFLLSPTWAPLPDFSVLSNATGALGHGAISGQGWFVGKWSIAQQSLSIAYKELFPVVISAMLWGHTWATKRVEFYSVNISVVSILGSITLKDPNMMVLLQYLSLVAAHNFFAFTAPYTAGQDNSIGDALSHFDFQRFHCLAPHAAHNWQHQYHHHLFIFQDGRSLSRALLSSFLQATLKAAGIPEKFSGHSFRIGAAIAAAHRGIPDHLIKTMGRWLSEAYLLYVHTPVDTILWVAGRIS